MKIIFYTLILFGFAEFSLAEEGEFKLEPYVVENSEYWKEMHPVPKGYSGSDYYTREWEVENNYILKFTGEYIGGKPLFIFKHNEPLAHAFPGFCLEGNKFTPRYLGFETLDDGEWKEVQIGYCSTGDQAFLLEPGVEYQVVIYYYKEFGEIQRFLLQGPRGMVFISEPFEVSELKF